MEALFRNGSQWQNLIYSAEACSVGKCCTVISFTARLTTYAHSHFQHRPLPRKPCISSPSPHNSACGWLLCPALIPVSESSPCHRPEEQPGWSAFPPAHGSLCSRGKKHPILRGLSKIKKLFHLLLTSSHLNRRFLYTVHSYHYNGMYEHLQPS